MRELNYTENEYRDSFLSFPKGDHSHCHSSTRQVNSLHSVNIFGLNFLMETHLRKVGCSQKNINYQCKG